MEDLPNPASSNAIGEPEDQVRERRSRIGHRPTLGHVRQLDFSEERTTPRGPAEMGVTLEAHGAPGVPGAFLGLQL